MSDSEFVRSLSLINISILSCSFEDCLKYNGFNLRTVGNNKIFHKPLFSCYSSVWIFCWIIVYLNMKVASKLLLLFNYMQVVKEPRSLFSSYLGKSIFWGNQSCYIKSSEALLSILIGLSIFNKPNAGTKPLFFTSGENLRKRRT